LFWTSVERKKKKKHIAKSSLHCGIIRTINMLENIESTKDEVYHFSSIE